ncbi:hypothetical protein PPTG_06795 [Phytophthora nicotianae INRA-310]|uniref:Uncharacterized protein n=2 Tax=Phytophthora nicotianae TaxID=4792 RepID=W2QRG1_PHYN3|nr:hypothetical protein PPTG_06795 [Phytophthora nicotianae INRA-310]ETN15546.1 hypothetical protein PPTG_06795 [Phytophthora nicotianae INRA-310]ETO85665.1 hypothetical protein F444_00700 [Phytophthora nicotianae P1976]
MSAVTKSECSFATQTACGSSNPAGCSIITPECNSSPYVMRVTGDSVTTAECMSVAVTDYASRTTKSAAAITKSAIITTSMSSRVVADKLANAAATNCMCCTTRSSYITKLAPIFAICASSFI